MNIRLTYTLTRLELDEIRLEEPVRRYVPRTKEWIRGNGLWFVGMAVLAVFSVLAPTGPGTVVACLGILFLALITFGPRILNLRLLVALAVPHPDVEITDSHFISRHGTISTTFEWSHFSGVVETSNLFIFQMKDTGEKRVIQLPPFVPKRAFPTSSDVESFRTFIAARISNKASEVVAS